MEVGSSSLPGTTRVSRGGGRLEPRLGGLAQLARAPALQAGGQRFESVILHRAPIEVQEIFDNLTHATKKQSKESDFPLLQKSNNGRQLKV